MLTVSMSSCDYLYRYWCLTVWVQLFVVILFFFFKQKTAYEMRISDWSSDVCSSDLGFTEARIETAGSCLTSGGSVTPRPARASWTDRMTRGMSDIAPLLLLT